MKNSMNIDLENIECGKNFYVYQEIENNDEITFHLKPKPHESRYASSKIHVTYHIKNKKHPILYILGYFYHSILLKSTI
jgi:hypothetical protein